MDPPEEMKTDEGAKEEKPASSASKFEAKKNGRSKSKPKGKGGKGGSKPASAGASMGQGNFAESEVPGSNGKQTYLGDRLAYGTVSEVIYTNRDVLTISRYKASFQCTTNVIPTSGSIATIAGATAPAWVNKYQQLRVKAEAGGRFRPRVQSLGTATAVRDYITDIACIVAGLVSLLSLKRIGDVYPDLFDISNNITAEEDRIVSLLNAVIGHGGVPVQFVNEIIRWTKPVAASPSGHIWAGLPTTDSINLTYTEVEANFKTGTTVPAIVTKYQARWSSLINTPDLTAVDRLMTFLFKGYAVPEIGIRIDPAHVWDKYANHGVHVIDTVTPAEGVNSPRLDDATPLRFAVPSWGPPVHFDTLLRPHVGYDLVQNDGTNQQIIGMLANLADSPDEMGNNIYDRSANFAGGDLSVSGTPFVASQISRRLWLHHRHGLIAMNGGNNIGGAVSSVPYYDYPGIAHMVLIPLRDLVTNTARLFDEWLGLSSPVGETDRRNEQALPTTRAAS